MLDKFPADFADYLAEAADFILTKGKICEYF